jgi:hypothetical protein
MVAAEAITNGRAASPPRNATAGCCTDGQNHRKIGTVWVQLAFGLDVLAPPEWVCRE